MNTNDITQKLRRALYVKNCGAVIVAAGTASRMGGIDKVMAQLGAEPMVLRTVRAFQACDVIRSIVIVTRQDLVEAVGQLCAGMDKVCAVVIGGKDRPSSVEAGLKALPKDTKLVAVHDGARPMITMEIIDRTVRAAHSYGAAALAIPVKDTIKVAKGGVVDTTPDRSKLRAVQTPQVFDLDLLKGALKKAREDNAEITDDCSAVERLGMSVKLVEGDERNIKVTTPVDLKIAQLFLEEMQCG